MLRRFLLLIALSFSFGGFSFYAAVVVPIGGRVLDATAQGFVTREVTHVLNVAALVTALAVAWEAFAGRRERKRWSNAVLFVAAALGAASTFVLVVLHPKLDAFLDGADFAVTEPEQFYRVHQFYLWISTVQWLVSLAVIWIVAGGGRRQI